MTSAIIAMIKNTQIISVRLHHNAFLENAGQILDAYYRTKDRVDELLKLGDLSVLGTYLNNPKEIPVNSDYPIIRATKAYHRDLDEPFHKTITPYIENMSDTELYHLLTDNKNADYLYLYSNGHWLFFEENHFCILSEYLENIQIQKKAEKIKNAHFWLSILQNEAERQTVLSGKQNKVTFVVLNKNHYEKDIWEKICNNLEYNPSVTQIILSGTLSTTAKEENT